MWVYLAVFGIQPRLGFFAGGIGVLILALTSPINALAEGILFSAHMMQHILLLLGVSALLLLGLPRGTSVPLGGLLNHPLIGWVAGIGSMWFWHAPALCNAAASSPGIRGLQSISLIGLGMMFWWQLLAPKEEDRLQPPQAVVYLFSACLACSVLGIIITLSPVRVCSAYANPATDSNGLLNMMRTDWGITPELDQQIGGLLMWVPMCSIYAAAILAQIARWFRSRPVEVS